MARTKQISISKDNSVSLNGKDTITINELTIKDQEVFTFLSDKEDKEEWLKKALVIGCIGLKNMIVGYNVDYVEKKFNELLKHTDEQFRFEREKLEEKIDEIFNPENKNSAVAKLNRKIEETFDEDDKNSPMGKLVKHLETYFDDKNGVVKGIIKETFDPKISSSPMAKFIENLDHYFDQDSGVLKKIIDGTFDASRKGTPLYDLITSIDNYFNEKTGILPKLLDKTFNPDIKTSVISHFIEQLDENFDMDKGKIKKLLDPSKPNSPAYLLKKEILDELIKIKEVMKIAEKTEEIENRTALKGKKFEDKVHEQLDIITQPYPDIVEEITAGYGRSGKSGDFIIKMKGDDNKIITVECKDTSYSAKRCIEILNDSIENRNAKYGILLFKEENQIPAAHRPIKVTKNGIITSEENHGLYLAYRMARFIIEKQCEDNGKKIPINEIELEIKDLLEKSSVINNMIKEVSKISNASDYLKVNLVALHTNIETTMSTIEKMLILPNNG